MTGTRRFKRALLLSSSVVALAVGNAAPAFAVCQSAPLTISAGQSVSRICITGSSASGNIANSGTIGAGGILFSSGTLTGSILGASGTFVGGIGLDATSILASTHTAIAINGGSFAGAISNAGTISAGNQGILVSNISQFGSTSAGGGIVNAGAITAGAGGIYVAGATTFLGGINNGGAISAGGDGIAVSKIVQFGNPSAGGGIVNTGTITAGPGGIVASDVSAFSGGISNGGAISAGVVGIAVAGVGAFTGGVSNSGTIMSGNFGISVSSVNQFRGPSAGGGIRNTGTIAANQTGILVENVSTFSGGISNGGAISANLTGINVSKVGQFGSPSAGGGIVNTGTIMAGITPTIGNLGAGISASATSFFGGISNGGTIISQSFGINLAAFDGSIFSGGIANSGTISAANAIFVTGASQFNGGITNSGLISSGTGIAVSDASTFSGNISNSGTIIASIGIDAGHYGGFSFAAGSGIVNSGTILASYTGITVNEGEALYGLGSVGGSITNSGTISAALGGILVSTVVQFGKSSAGGSIVNSGTITAGGNGIDVENVGVFTGGISNSGTISSGSLGIVVTNVFYQFGSPSVGGGIVNSGAITARYTGIFAGGASTISGGISNSGTITAGHSGIVVAVFNTFLGGISNSGAITARDDGIGVFSAVQFSGSSMGGGIVNGGAITAGHNGIIVLNVDTFSGGITNFGTISSAKAGILYGDSFSFLGGISNSGNITAKTGIFVGAAGAFSGGISNSGTISAATGIEIAAAFGFAAGSDVVNSGTISGSTAAIDASIATSPVTIDQTAGLISGAIKLSAYADVLNISGGTIAGNILGQGTSDTINFMPGAGAAFTYASAYGFTGVNQVDIDAGTTVLEGSNSATATAVNAGGALAGTGMLTSALVVNNGGKLSPGNPGSPGTFFVTGSLAFASGSTYAVTINGATVSQTVVTGSATLGGARISVALPPPLLLGTYPAHTYDILTTTAPLGAGNTFNPTVMVTQPGPIVAPNVTYDANNVYLSVPVYHYTLDLLANSPTNAHNIANALNAYIVAGGTLPDAIQPLGRLSGASVGSALNQLGGQAPGDSALSAFAAGDLFLNLLLDPNVDGRGGDRPTAGGAPPVGYVALAPSLSPAPVLWASAYGGSGQISGNAATGAAATSLSVYGFAAGADFHFAPDAMIGFAFGAGSSGSGSGAFGGSSSQMFQAGVFGRYSPGPAYVAGSLAFSTNEVSVTRAGGLAGEQKGDFASNGLSSRIEAGYALPASFSFVLTPYAAAQAQALSMPTFAESAQAGGSPLSLTYAGRTFTTDRIELGAWLDDTLSIGGGAVKLFGRLAYAHDFNNDSAVTAVFQSLPSASFVINSAKPAPDGALATLGARYDLAAGWSVQARFDGEFSGTTSFYAATGVIRKSW
jgi:uncharacterized protein with beta-barrel porin domain